MARSRLDLNSSSPENIPVHNNTLQILFYLMHHVMHLLITSANLAASLKSAGNGSKLPFILFCTRFNG